VTAKDAAAHNGKFLGGKVMVCDKLRVICPLGCGVKMLFRDKEAHFGDPTNPDINAGCVKAKVHCPLCGMKAMRSEIPEHLEVDCIKRTVPCMTGGVGCGEMMREDERLQHQEIECSKRIVPCRVKQPNGTVGCGICDLKFEDRPRHESEEEKLFEEEIAKRRLAEKAMRKIDPEPCPRGCGEIIMPHMMHRHLDLVCSLRFKKIINVGVTFGVAIKARCLHDVDFGMRGKLPPVVFDIDKKMDPSKVVEKRSTSSTDIRSQPKNMSKALPRPSSSSPGLRPFNQFTKKGSPKTANSPRTPGTVKRAIPSAWEPKDQGSIHRFDSPMSRGGLTPLAESPKVPVLGEFIYQTP